MSKDTKLGLISLLWCIITIPLVILVPPGRYNNDIFMTTWILWCILGMIMTPKIVNKFCK